MTHPDGKRALVRELGETPQDAIEHHLAIEAQAPPDPADLAPTDVLIAVSSAGVGWVDLLMMSGQYQHVPEPPYTPGMEYAGTVLWRGDAVRGVDEGAEVIVDGLLTGPRSLGAHRRWGGFASYAVAPAEAVVPKPGPLSADAASVLLGAYETAYHCLLHRGEVRAGDVVLIHGSSGTTGLAAVHLAKLAGATVIATGRSRDKLDVVLEEGADHVVDTSDLAALRPAVKELTGGRGVDVVYDPVGGPISAESMRCVAFGARFLVVGWAATPFVAKGKGGRGAPNVNVLPTNLIMMKSLDVRGCPAAISAHRDPLMRAERREKILTWATAGRITPRVGATYPMDRLVEALEAKWKSAVVGSVVLHPSA
ncbi:MAG: NADPH:quinone oxidoreductase family protein [Sandaracinaceae bacterium]|nr:NADPH:quinone oxidoreductase family protein [Sandaracinaceae bacterium]